LLSSTLLIDLEAGDLPVADLQIASIRPRTWEDCRDIACVLGGADPARAPGAPYSHNHYERAIADSTLAALQQYSIIFVDSFTELSRRVRAWSEQQPEAFNAYGKKDLRSVYGLTGRELIGWTGQLQHTRARTIAFTAVLEKVVDDHGSSSWQIQLEGQRTRRELPAILDLIIAMVWVPFKDKPRRAFVCQSDVYPTKDRSGRLEPIEEPNLGKLLAKLTTRQQTGE
jgi:AAA domain